MTDTQFTPDEVKAIREGFRLAWLNSPWVMPLEDFLAGPLHLPPSIVELCTSN